VQVNAVLLRASVRLLVQASEEPLFTWAVVSVPAPAASRVIVTAWQVATGAVLSSTVTVKVQLLVLLLPSVAVNVTVISPRADTEEPRIGNCVNVGVMVQLSLAEAKLV
jgi:hypothetical protein